MNARLIASLGALALVIAGCSSSNPSATTSSSTSTSTAPTTTVQPGQVQVIAQTATGRSPCEIASPTPASPGQVGAGTGGSESNVKALSEIGHGGRGMVTQLTLTHAQHVELERQMEQARTVVAKYPTVARALADDYDESTPYVPCIGAHYTKLKLVTHFDPLAPSELLYDGTSPDSKIVGLSYLVYHPNGPPAGFAGPNDHWHQHNANGGLCLRGGFVVGGEDTSPQQCATRGGKKTRLTDIWMMHAWVVPGFECTWGVFSGECPELGGRLGGTAWETPVPSKTLSGDSAKG